MKSILSKLISLFLLTTLTACSLPGATSLPATSVPDGEPAATEEAASLPPSDFAAILDEKVASGEWMQEQGLVTLLQVFAGEVTVEQAAVDTSALLEAEGNGILSLAAEYLDTGTDETTKAEITRLLNVLIPSQTALDLYSVPEGEASSRGPGLAAPIAYQDQDCAALWAAGFPDTRSSTFRCFQFGERTAAGQTLRVYYPLAWRGDEIREAFYTATLEAAQDSLNTFQAYGTVRPIYFVFTTLAHTDNPTTTLATAYWDSFRPGEACPVIIYPRMLTLDGAQFKQSVAHEVFHCFESWNLRDQGIGAGYTSSQWWVEGAAEYFSNLVYPSTNYEYRFAGSFSDRSNTIPLTGMTYQNFIFFQFLGNILGPDGVIGFLNMMPTTSGIPGQLAALSAFPNMQDLWEEFAISIFDRTLLDSDGSVANIPPSVGGIYNFSAISSLNFSGQPFVLARYRVVFDSEKEFSVLSTQSGTGRSGARPFGTVGGWAPIPGTVTARCEEIPYLLYTLTTTIGAVRTETITTTLISDLPCDRCLIGSWEATNESFMSYLQSINASSPDTDVNVEAVTGRMFVVFNENGSSSAGYDNLLVQQSIAGVGLTGNAATTDMFITFNGTSTGTYIANGETVIGSGPGGTIVVTVDTYVDNNFISTTNIPLRPEDFPGGSATPTRYTCSGSTLTMWPPVPGITVAPIIYNKANP